MIEIGTIRIKINGQVVEKTNSGWKKSTQNFPEAKQVLRLFKAQKNLKALIDPKQPSFLKGQLSLGGQVQGARVNVLPNGEKLNKAYSLFSTHLRIHDQDSDDHWDVLYQNKGNTWAYCYTLEKKRQHQTRKYKKVQEFGRTYQRLIKKVTLALKDKEDHLAVPMYTLLKTQMRIGNETYYKAHGHKGLTTLKKNDIAIKGKVVSFNYLAKDGVPRLILQKFPEVYIKRLKRMIKPLQKNQFVFTCKTGHPLKEPQFKKAFGKYCGKEFYPHIVRSYYATTQVQTFLKGKRKLTKEQKNELFLSIAAKLGHQKFVKKEQQWKDNATVTINHYIQPKLVERVNQLVKEK